MVLLLVGLKGCQIIRHASLKVPQPTKQTIPQSIVLIWNKVASGWKCFYKKKVQILDPQAPI